MAKQKFRVILTSGAREFLKSIPFKAQEKISFNIRRVMGGEINNELFKKLEKKLPIGYLHFGIQKEKLL